MSNLPATRDFSNDQIELIKKTIAPSATPQEFELFIYRCKHMDLDPLVPGEIYFIKYGNSPGTIVVGIEGFRKRAERSGKRSGVKRGVLRDSSGKCIGAWCEVYRSDWVQPAREEVSLTEYTTGKGNWAKMPETMIKKVAEAAALRMAFQECQGLYIKEEMEQAEARDAQPAQTQQATLAPSEPKTLWPSNYPEEIASDKSGHRRFIEDFETDELNTAAVYLEKWRDNKTTKFPFAEKQKLALDLVLYLLEKTQSRVSFTEEDLSFDANGAR